MYDITNKESFHRAKKWIEELQSQGPNNVLVALAGNKLDREEERDVKESEAHQYANDNNLYFVECSAKTNVNVREIFYYLARQLPKEAEKENGNSNGFRMDPDFQLENKKKKKCCIIL